MDKNDFIKAMEEMLAVAKTNGNQISMEELLDYFSDVPMNEETRKLLFDTFEEAGVRVIGYEAEKKRKNQRLCLFIRKRLPDWIFRMRRHRSNCSESGWKERAIRNRSSRAFFLP